MVRNQVDPRPRAPGLELTHPKQTGRRQSEGADQPSAVKADTCADCRGVQGCVHVLLCVVGPDGSTSAFESVVGHCRPLHDVQLHDSIAASSCKICCWRQRGQLVGMGGCFFGSWQPPTSRVGRLSHMRLYIQVEMNKRWELVTDCFTPRLPVAAACATARHQHTPACRQRCPAHCRR